MTIEMTAGIILCIIGLLLSSKPTLLWEFTEKMNKKVHEEPSQGYMTLMRVVSGVCIGFGILFAAGILKQKKEAFDWGKTSEDYARFRDIYPQEFYDFLKGKGVGASMNETLLHAWDKEHRTMLETCADEAFTVKHYVSCAELILRRKSI